MLKVSALTTLFVLSLLSCTSHPPRTQPPAISGGSVFGPAPEIKNENPVSNQPMGPPEAPKHVGEAPHVTLVLGGAGVAGFATVGLLKKFNEEGIKIDNIVTTGWPTLFALGYGFQRSIHDVEWFAMRLGEKDFSNASMFEIGRGGESQERLSELITNAFAQTDLSQSKTPVVISATNTDQGEPETYDHGDWKEPLLKTMSIPGIYRSYPKDSGNQNWVNSIRGIDVEAAAHRGAKQIVAVEMYDDYFTFLKDSHKNGDAIFRKLYLSQMTKSLQNQLQQANVVGHIRLHKAPNDFSAKRAAILAGYKEGARLAKELRAQYGR